MRTPDAILGLLWAAWLAGWCLAAAFSARTIVRQSRAARLAHSLLFWAGGVLIVRHPLRSAILESRLLPDGDVIAWVGVLIVILGLAYAVQARIQLGRLWSGTVTRLADRPRASRRTPRRGSMTPARAAILLAAVLTTMEARASAPAGSAGSTAGDSAGTGECFLLYEIGVGEIRRAPSEICRTRVTPASTFKIPHALAALDSGVVSGPDETFKYDGSPMPVESWKRDHTLASAIRHSVVWYFQRVATKLGLTREREYLHKFEYGNEDPDDRLTSFWLGGSLVISPEEQERFLLRLYQDALPVSRKAMREVREMLRQPAGRIVSANGERPFDPPWPQGTVVEAKTGRSADRSGRRVLWLVGRVGRGDRSWIFVSCVITTADLDADAAIDLAARSLHEEHVL